MQIYNTVLVDSFFKSVEWQNIKTAMTNLLDTNSMDKKDKNLDW